MPCGSAGKGAGSRLTGRHDQYDAVGGSRLRSTASTRTAETTVTVSPAVAWLPSGATGAPSTSTRSPTRTSAATSGSAMRTGTATDSPGFRARPSAPDLPRGRRSAPRLAGSHRRPSARSARPPATTTRRDDPDRHRHDPQVSRRQFRPRGQIPGGHDDLRGRPAAATGARAPSGRSASTAATTSRTPITTRRGHPASRAPIRASRTRCRPRRRAR